MLRNKILQLDPRDNVLVALADLHRGEQIDFGSERYTLESEVPAKHKFSIEDLAIGSEVYMYGVLVGQAVTPIRQGEALTTSNTQHKTAGIVEQCDPYRWEPPDVSRWKNRKFLGYLRSDGQVGTRNYWLVVPLVFCENRNIVVLKQAFEEELGFTKPQPYRQQVARLVQLYREGQTGELNTVDSPDSSATNVHAHLFQYIDGIRFLLHEGGCGGTREDSNNLCGLIAGYIHHPNVAGATILSLGCQHAQIEILRQQLKQRDPNFDKPLVILEQQQSGSEFVMLSEAVKRTFLGLVEADKYRRTAAPLSHLCVGLKCGGSDGFSGISANPAIGHTADLLVALGARAILSEFPELCGVEQDLVNRCSNQQTADRFMRLMRDYDARAKSVGSGFEMNPSPGNIRDGLITDAMKSAGAAKKGGTAPIAAVLDYPEYSMHRGLHLQCTPGNDVECVTAQVGAGASLVLFTTGLGTPTGNPIAPVVKLSTTSTLAQHMSDIVDVDTGDIISGTKTTVQMGEEILDFVINVASGEIKTKAELNAQTDFIPWKRGVSL